MVINERRAGTLLSYLYIIVNTVVVLVYQKIILSVLGESEFGLYQLAASIINYMSVMDLGFNNGIVNYTAKYRATGKDSQMKVLHGMFKVIFYGIGIVALIVGAVLTLNVETFFGASMTAAEIEKGRIIMAVLTVNMGLTFAFSIYNAIIVAYEKFVFVKVLTILRSLLNPLIMLPLLLVGGDSVTMVIVLAGVNIFCLLLNYFYSRKKLGIKVKYCGFDKAVFLEIFSYSIFIFIAEIVDKINWSVDQIILGIVKGTKEVAVYSVASTYNQLMISLSGCVTSVLLPKIATMVAVKETDRKINELFIKASRIQIYTVMLVFFGFVLVGQEFVLWHAGKECAGAYWVGLILMAGVLIPLTQSVAITIIKAKDKFKFRAIILLIMAMMNIVISIFLAIEYGSVGSAFGTGITLIIANVIVMDIYYNKCCGIDVKGYWKNLLMMLVKLVPCVIIVYVVKMFLPISGVAGIFVYGTVFVLLYCIVSYMFVMNEYEKDIIKRYFAKVVKF